MSSQSACLQMHMAGSILGRLRLHASPWLAVSLTRSGGHAIWRDHFADSCRSVSPALHFDQDGFSTMPCNKAAILRRDRGLEPRAKDVDEIVIRLEHAPGRADRIIVARRHHGDVQLCRARCLTGWGGWS